ncbi:MAG: NUDIX hydrolase [bacterium]|nr:NUDIX hydrolase [bacterium]
MFVTDELIREMEERFGVPVAKSFRIPSTTTELQRIASSQKSGRNHDVTLYVQMGEKWIVIAKHAYPEGLFRSPSGGLHPGEDFLTGINREVAEELGCRIRVDRFLLKTDVEFFLEPVTPTDANQTPIHWRSWVFLATYLDGDFNYTDHDEIREVKVVDWEQFAEYGKIMRTTDTAGLHYRAQLHESVAEILGKP